MYDRQTEVLYQLLRISEDLEVLFFRFLAARNQIHQFCQALLATREVCVRFFFSAPILKIAFLSLYLNVFATVCYFNMKKSPDVTLSSLNLRMS